MNTVASQFISTKDTTTRGRDPFCIARANGAGLFYMSGQRVVLTTLLTTLLNIA